MIPSDNLVSLIIIATLGILTLCAFIIVFVVMYQKNMMQKNHEIRALVQQKQIELFDAASQAEEREKERIARNLHDEINPMLTLLKQNLQKHKFDFIKNKFSVDHFENDYVLIEKIAEGIRSSSYELVPSFMIKYGLIDSLTDYIRGLNDIRNLKAQITKNCTDNPTLPLTKSDQLNIYRMCLEITNNLIKHALCDVLNLSVTVLEQELSIELNHNGQGIDNSDIDEIIKTSKGLGLKSLKARALILNGDIINRLVI